MQPQFLPPERASKDQLRSQTTFLRSLPLLNEVTETLPEVFLILNRQRQIVYVNKALSQFTESTERDSVGKRVGEALKCIHASETKGGCGTTEFCRQCGVAKAILKSQHGETNAQDCRITRKEDRGSLDLRVGAKPLKFTHDQYTAFTVSDRSHENRRRALERIFFHDVLNTAGALQGFAELSLDANEADMAVFRQQIFSLAQSVVEELKAQRDLAAAENHELQYHATKIQLASFLNDVAHSFDLHPAAKSKTVAIRSIEDCELMTDPILLRRVIGNLVKNALEASPEGGTVTIGYESEDERFSFWVHNSAFMSRDIQLQIFQRSFTTKGRGRGLGTYSVKLLTERYLKGTVTFTSSLDDGTTFFVGLPQRPDREEQDLQKQDERVPVSVMLHSRDYGTLSQQRQRTQ